MCREFVVDGAGGIPDPVGLRGVRREAHLLAALNHPNIAVIHGLDEADGKPFLVLELVPGEDLAQRLKRGPIPLDEALPLARQVAGREAPVVQTAAAFHTLPAR